jgi:eukaryotic-like serine/threonine-protein kinase
VRRLLAHARDSARADWTWSLRRALPPELRTSAASRVGKLGLITVATLLAFCLLNIQTNFGDVGQRGIGPAVPAMIAASIALLLSIGIFAVSRWKRDEPHLIIALALPYQLLMATAIGVCEYGMQGQTGAVDVHWSGVAVWIVIFAVFVPNIPVRTLCTSSAAALLDPLVYCVAVALRGEPLPDLLTSLKLFGPTALAVATAVVAASITFRLGRQVHDARQMGSYRLVQLLGKGGMGEVWRAEHERLARPAAIKLIKADAVAGPGAVENASQRFEREAHATALLQSEHTIELYDFGIAEDGTFYYVMELLDGLDLDDLVQRTGPMPPARAVHCLLQICDSLAEAHARGLVHRDIKPSNIYLCRRGLHHDVVKVLDFGLVKTQPDLVDRSGALTAEGTVQGTPAFAVPEILQRAEPIDGRADLYAVGCVAWWLLTGRLVFEADSAVMMVARHLNTEPPRLSDRADQPIPADLEALVHECLAKDPQQRPADAAELARRLAAVDIQPGWDQEAARAWWQAHPGSGATGETADPEAVTAACEEASP